MACLRYIPETRSWVAIKASQMTQPDRGQGLSFKDQMLRGYRKAEAKGQPLAGRPSNIKTLWANA